MEELQIAVSRSGMQTVLQIIKNVTAQELRFLLIHIQGSGPNLQNFLGKWIVLIWQVHL